ncbi:MAG: A24 family peptidase [Clostridiales bacterium]|nr:A24 family peptidase [Clostridiales bacterium]
MEIAILLVATVLLCMVGTGLFRFAGEYISDALTTKEPPEDTAGEGPQTGDASPSRAMIAGMFVVSVAMALFMRLFYGTDLLTIINTVALCTVLWTCAWSDYKVFLIPNRILLIGLLERGVLLAVQCLMDPENLVYYLVRSLLAAVVLLAVCGLCRLISAKAIGFGDIKLMALMGLFLGTDLIWAAMLFSMVAVFLCSLVLLLTKRADRQTEIPFAPFLLVGTVLAAFLTSV